MGNVNSRKPVKCILVHFGIRKINLARKRAPTLTGFISDFQIYITILLI